VFVVGFAPPGELTDTLDGVAAAGGSEHAYAATSSAELTNALDRVMSEVLADFARWARAYFSSASTSQAARVDGAPCTCSALLPLSST
jgi:hypothetical protein